MILNKKLLLGIVGGIVASFLLVTAGVYHEQVFGAFDFTIIGSGGSGGGDGVYDNLDVSGTVTTTNLFASGVVDATAVSSTSAVIETIDATDITAETFYATTDGDYQTAVLGWSGGTGFARAFNELIVISQARGGYNFVFGGIANATYADLIPAYDAGVSPVNLGGPSFRFANGYIANTVSVTTTVDNVFIGSAGPLVTRLPIKYHNYASTTLDFANSVSDGEQDLEITVEGAVDGGICALGLPSALGSRALEWYTCHTSSTADVLVVRRHCRNVIGCGDPDPAGVSAAYIGH